MYQLEMKASWESRLDTLGYPFVATHKHIHRILQLKRNNETMQGTLLRKICQTGDKFCNILLTGYVCQHFLIVTK